MTNARIRSLVAGAPRASLIDARNCNVRNDQDLRANTLSAHVVPARVISARKMEVRSSHTELRCAAREIARFYHVTRHVSHSLMKELKSVTDAWPLYSRGKCLTTAARELV